MPKAEIGRLAIMRVSKGHMKHITSFGAVICTFCVIGLSACANGTVTQEQYPNVGHGYVQDAAHGYMKAKSPLLNPDDLIIRVKPLHTEDEEYVKVVSEHVFVTDGWYLIEYSCPGSNQPKGQTNAPKKEHKPIHLNSGELGYKLTCKLNDLDIDTLIEGGPIEIVE